MITNTNKNECAVFVTFFVLCITLLIVNIINKFNYLDLAYLLFFIGCFFRYIYIKVIE